MEKIWLIGDTHFGHHNILKYCNRPFKNTDEMDNKIISNWNSVVKKLDKIIVVGDFSLDKKENIIKIGNKLNGRKILLLGNHDKASKKTYYEAGFESVIDYPIIIEDFAIISHKPIFVTEEMPYINIFAHVHNNPNYLDYTKNGFCVSVERINYTPILLSSIVKKIKNI